MWHEYVGNVHLHTTASDGKKTLDEVVALAGQAGLDFLMPTDHNTYLSGQDGWRGKTLLLVGQEIHDTEREPQVNHLLVFNVQEDLRTLATDPQHLIDEVARRGGLSFIAHPFEYGGAYSGEPNIDWVNWEVSGFTGIGIWNYMSEFKSYVQGPFSGVLAAFFPLAFMRGPFPETLRRWDELLERRKTAALCASDAHGTTYHLGPLRRVVLPYDWLFRAINMHVLTQEPFSHDPSHDAAVIYGALARGSSFVAYDRIGLARGFRFTARSSEGLGSMGDELRVQSGVELTAEAPFKAHLRLLRNGQIVASAFGTRLRHSTEQPGAYRVEAYKRSWLRTRGWIFSNPIYLTA